KLGLTPAAAASARAIKLMLCDLAGAVEWEKQISASAGKDVYALSGLPRLPRGKHYLNVWLLDGQNRIMDWSSRCLEVLSEFRIKEVVLDRRGYCSGDSVSGTVCLARNAGEGSFLELELYDGNDRLLDKCRIRNNSEVSKFSLKLKNPTANVGRLKVNLMEGDKIMDQTEKEFGISLPVPKEEDFYCLSVFMCGGRSKDWLIYQFFKAVAATGVEGGWNAGSWPTMPLKAGDTEAAFETGMMMGKAGLGIVPYVVRLGGLPKKVRFKHDIRVPCFSDPGYLAKFRKMVQKRGKGYKPFQPLMYQLGDECSLCSYGYGEMDLCRSKTCLAGFRKYLEEQYGNLDKLNKHWESGFASWNDVVPLTLKAAQAQRKYASWVDHRIYMDSVFVGANKTGADAVHEFDPEGRVTTGLNLWTTSENGYNWPELMKFLGSVHVYAASNGPREEAELVRSLGRPGTLKGAYYGSYTVAQAFNECFQRQMPWRHLFRHLNAPCLYSADAPGRIWPGFRGDYSPFDFWKQTTEEIKEIKQGIGKLLLNAARENDGIAILYSRRSHHCAAALGSIFNSWRAFIRLLEGSGYQFRFISDDMLDYGTLKDYRVLVLPAAFSIGEKGADAIKQFVSNGGILVSDIKPGIMDEHGKIHSGKGALDAILGISRNTKDLTVASELDGGMKNPKFKGLQLQTDPGIKAEKGEVIDKINGLPLVIVNKYGRGTSIYFNFNLSVGKIVGDWACYAVTPGYIKRQQYFGQILSGELRELGITPKERGFTFRSGAARYIGSWQGKNDNLTLSVPAHVYEIRGKRYLGYGTKFNNCGYRKSPSVYALMPYKIDGVELQLDKTSYKKGDAVSYTIELKVSDKTQICPHVFHLEVYGPDNKLCRYYTRNLFTEKGVSSGCVPLALNQKPGIYRIVLNETVSGAKIEKTFDVK
ncbi:MAG: beta-galactosidase trimerization domain-containing protein, partial [Victivallaceae bacterium]|nr:beta-galactosidase trimerization domain-containing protein [Victivallaceae bacterium]